MKLCCLLLIGITLSVRAESPGRLFFSPEERRRLEQPPPPATPRIDGVLVSSSGLRLRWVDNRLEPGEASPRSTGGPAVEKLRTGGGFSVMPEKH